jgi:uncharacterized protein (DUF1697 family)
MTTFIALLRGINVGGHKKIAMAELRALCADCGCASVQSYIQSGNLVFASPGAEAAIAADLEAAIAARFGFAVDVLVRSAQKWPTLRKGNPFPQATATEPNLVLMALAKRSPHKEAVAALREHARSGERIESAGEAIWFHFPQGVARSKLSPALIDRLVGSPVTARNVRTVDKLAELAAACAAQ